MLADASGLDGYDVPGSLRCEGTVERASFGETFTLEERGFARRGSRSC